jgi:hypothetical protein
VAIAVVNRSLHVRGGLDIPHSGKVRSYAEGTSLEDGTPYHNPICYRRVPGLCLAGEWDKDSGIARDVGERGRRRPHVHGKSKEFGARISSAHF